MDRRVILTGIGAALLTGGAGYGLAARTSARYADAVAACRRPLDLSATGADRLAELVRFASLAPNSHNTQGWTFVSTPNGVRASVDLARRTPAVDPDDHHLFVSLGAAVETLVIAATAYGVIVRPEAAPDGAVTLRFPEGAAASPLLPAIVLRQSHRGLYDGAPLTDSDRNTLLSGDAGLRLIEDAPSRAALRDLSTAALRVQMEDAAYRAELETWLRFSRTAALRTGDGLFSGCGGNPALPQGLGHALFPLLATATGQAEALAAQMDSTPALMLFVTDPDTPEMRIGTGRRLQRVSLAATLAGLSVAHVNPALENPEGRAEVARLCDVAAGRPSLLLRVGRAAGLMPYSLRRQAQQILLS